MENNTVPKSRESGVYISDTKTFSLTPKIVPTGAHDPYKIFDEDKSKIRFMINDRTNANDKKYATANISLTELKTLDETLSLAQSGLITNWSLPTVTKIFGTPDEQGYMKCSHLTVQRQAIDNTGKAKRFPWYIAIQTGKGKGAAGKHAGAVYLAPNTFQAEVSLYVNLTDADFRKMTLWTTKIVDIFANSMSTAIISNYKEFLADDMKNGRVH